MAYNYILQTTILLFLCAVVVLTLSTQRISKDDTSTDHEHSHNETVEETVDCHDSVNRCSEPGLKEQICKDPIRKHFCRRTCHVCHKAPSPVVDCASSVFGCCWDGLTAKSGYYQEGCPPCEDDKVFAGLCPRWEKHCSPGQENQFYHDFAVKYCHRTCGKCDNHTTTPRPPRTLPSIAVEESHSDNKPRNGAKYVWTKVKNYQ